MSSFFEPATPVDGAREVRTPGTPVESPPEPAENSAMDSIYEFMSGLLSSFLPRRSTQWRRRPKMTNSLTN